MKFNRGHPISTMVHPRSVSLIGPNRNIVSKVMAGLVFGNIRCRVRILTGGCRLLMRDASVFPMKARIKVGISPFSVRVVGGPRSRSRRTPTIRR